MLVTMCKISSESILMNAKILRKRLFMNINLSQSCFYDVRGKGKVLRNRIINRAWWMNQDY